MNPRKPDVLILSADEAIGRAAAFFVDSVARREGELSVCLTGGEDASRLFQRIAREGLLERIPWERMHWFWSDERFVLPDHPDSNQKMCVTELLRPGGAPADHIHPIEIAGCSSADEAAARYSATLDLWRMERVAAGKPLFDFVLHGIGPDGHTASLYPGQAHAGGPDQLAIAVNAPDCPPFVARVSLTLAALNDSASGLLFSFDESKAEAIARILAGEDLPAARVRSHGPLPWIFSGGVKMG